MTLAISIQQPTVKWWLIVHLVVSVCRSVCNHF